MSRKPRFVFDTSAIISALLFEQSVPGQAFHAALGEGEILLSIDTFAEITEVVSRTKFDRYVTLQEREQFLVKLLLGAILVEITREIRACRDPKDDKFLELAVAGSAACIVSGDQDLLVMHPFESIPIMTPAEVLQWIAEQRPR